MCGRTSTHLLMVLADHGMGVPSHFPAQLQAGQQVWCQLLGMLRWARKLSRAACHSLGAHHDMHGAVDGSSEGRSFLFQFSRLPEDLICKIIAESLDRDMPSSLKGTPVLYDV